MRRTSIPALAATALLLLGPVGCGDDDPDTTAAGTTTAAPVASTTSTTLVPPELSDLVASDLEMSPVLGSGPCAEGSPGTPDREGMLCYELGTPFGDGFDLTDATVVVEQETPVVQVSARPEAVDRLNEGFDSCFAGAPTCPPFEGGHGYVAITLAGEVLAAPAVMAEGLASGTISIQGDLTEPEARAIAGALEG